jgi:hypothetical protein
MIAEVVGDDVDREQEKTDNNDDSMTKSKEKEEKKQTFTNDLNTYLKYL